MPSSVGKYEKATEQCPGAFSFNTLARLVQQLPVHLLSERSGAAGRRAGGAATVRLLREHIGVDAANIRGNADRHLYVDGYAEVVERRDLGVVQEIVQYADVADANVDQS